MLNAVKHLANVSCKVPARDPSDATLCQDDTHRGTICILGQLLYYLHIICTMALFYYLA